MRVVVDTNILFSFFWEGSLTKKLLDTSRFELVAPELAFRELIKYKEEIKKKTSLREKEFTQTLSDLKRVVKFIDKRKYPNNQGICLQTASAILKASIL